MARTGGRPVVSRWARHPRCVALARAELCKVLVRWRLTEVSDDALLVLSELLTNAVRHAQGSRGREIETRYSREPHGVRIEVHDAAQSWPQPCVPDVDADGGRGLTIVAALAACWGTEVRDGGIGKLVWAVVAAPDGGEA
ncbi:ATP-binding protein [Streptomyces sp. WZ-12]|uniref:ATP-binding protein n=1 Tax=Streptomyces sp. WZ-12 TaxID=3030210 RepID=UPI002381338F|nr:ATP-binding protein [Streptomyces sp. WZ-12]